MAWAGYSNTVLYEHAHRAMIAMSASSIRYALARMSALLTRLAAVHVEA